jgi:D-alanyl-lipoteichoic acid acyltransferase DltB (MBOAT superfamily)
MWWRPALAILLLTSTAVDYWAALRMSRRASRARRRPYLLASLVVNLGLLATFKYLDFALRSLGALLAVTPPEFGILLPIGISFYTFQTIGYSVDVYRGRIQAERSFVKLAVFVSFWPQLVAGPIERARHLLPQLDRRVRFRYRRARDGLIRMAWGFFKKVVIADRLALFVNPVFADPASQPDAVLLLAAYAFVVQIYCDFSGYSDIAIGAARVMGIDLMENFRRPLWWSTSIADFWRRWHISLTTWLRDYLFFPLQGRSSSTVRWSRNIFITFVLCGLWHGAAWTFVVFGALHGAMIVVERFIAEDIAARSPKWSARLAHPWTLSGKRLLVFNLVTLSVIFFRAGSLADAWLILRSLADGIDGAGTAFLGLIENENLILGFAFTLVLAAVEGLLGEESLEAVLARRHHVVRLTAVALLVAVIFWFGVFNADEFIYFQF